MSSTLIFFPVQFGLISLEVVYYVLFIIFFLKSFSYCVKSIKKTAQIEPYNCSPLMMTCRTSYNTNINRNKKIVQSSKSELCMFGYVKEKYVIPQTLELREFIFQGMSIMRSQNNGSQQ